MPRASNEQAVFYEQVILAPVRSTNLLLFVRSKLADCRKQAQYTHAGSDGSDDSLTTSEADVGHDCKYDEHESSKSKASYRGVLPVAVVFLKPVFDTFAEFVRIG